MAISVVMPAESQWLLGCAQGFRRHRRANRRGRASDDGPVTISWRVPPGDGQSCPITYGEFSQRVRRYPRTPLLRALAAVSAKLEEARRDGARGGGVVQPFTVAGVARTALRAANEHRSAGIDDYAIGSLCSAFINLEDPDITEDGIAEGALTRLMARITHEQFAHQYSPMENISRSVALLLEHHSGVPNAPSPQDWAEPLGVDLEQYMNIGFAAYIAVCQNRGAIARELLQAEHVLPIWEPVGAGRALAVLQQHFITDLDSARTVAQDNERPGFARWSFNPLVNRPLLAVDGDLLAPAAHFVLDKITPTSLYFVGLATWGLKFTTALGGMFEAYVGSNLRLIAGAQVHPEIVYGSSEHRSCDYIVVLDDLVMLVEAKAARPAIDVRMGADGNSHDLSKKIGHARDQLEETARLVRGRYPEFTHIPVDREMVGLIVTLEPFHPRQTMLNETLLSGTTIPITAAWSHDLEGTVAGLQAVPDAGSRMRRAVGHADPAQRDLRTAADDRPERNPILDAAYARWEAAGPRSRFTTGRV